MGSSLRTMRLRPTVRDIAIVLAVSWVARAVFVAAIGDHHSVATPTRAKNPTVITASRDTRPPIRIPPIEHLARVGRFAPNVFRAGERDRPPTG
jgi:hypothetical protein